jgi:hypothetical protein
MKVLSTATFSQISFLIRGVNYKNIYALLNQNLSYVDIRFFSKIEQRNNEALWYVDSSDAEGYKKFKDATPEEKSEIAELIEERKSHIKSKIASLKEIAEYGQQIFSIPSEDQIFFTYDSNNRLIVTLAQWGCRNVSQADGINLYSGLINVPRSDKVNVNLLIKYTDNTPIADETFYFSFENDHPTADVTGKPITTNAEGEKSLGKLKKGVSFTVSDKPDKSGCNHTITVSEEMQYELLFPYYTSYSVLVVNQFGEPIANEKICAGDQLFTTDDEGRFAVDKIEYLPDTVIELSLASDTEKNARFDLQKNAEENNFKFELTVDCEYNLTINTLLETGEKVPNYKMQVEKDGEKMQYSTDENGELAFKDLTPGEEITVVDWNNPENKKTATIQRGENRCDLIIELPAEKRVSIKLLDLEGKPIKGTTLNVKTKAGVFTGTTDLDGYIHLPFSNFKDKEKVKVNFSIVKE